MSSRKTAILIGAIAVGIVAVVLIWQYVRGIENSIVEESQPVPVFIAKNAIPRGTDGSQAVTDGSIDAAQIPQKFKPGTAITSQDAVQKKVALFDIAPGTVIVNDMFVDPSTTQISFRERLQNKTHVAISVQVDQVKGVGGFLVPGDEVNLMIMQDNSRIREAVTGGAGDATMPPALLEELNRYAAQHNASTIVKEGGPQWMIFDKTARYLYQKVQILAVGQTQLLSPGEQAQGTEGETGAGNSGLITFNVPADAAQWIATGAESGLYLSLVPKDYTPTPLAPLPVIEDMLPGEDPAQLCPYYRPDDKGCAAAAG